jgi:hypothetical protein
MLLATTPPMDLVSMREDYISGCGHLSIVMPQENFTLIDFDWDKSVDSLRNSRIINGDFDNEIIAHNKGKLCLYIKVEGEDISFHLSLNGKLQISSPNRELLRRAESQLRKIITCSKWVPSGEERESRNGKVEYQSIMDLPEAKEADWSRIPKSEVRRLYKMFLLSTNRYTHFVLDDVRTTLASYAKSDEHIENHVETKETKSLKGKAKKWLNTHKIV